MPQSLEDALSYTSRWLEIIQKTEITEAEGKQIIEESQHNFAEHFNKGWLDYRKSVTEAGDWAAVEWSGSGATFRDVLGREYIDCLGGYGVWDDGSRLESSRCGRGGAGATLAQSAVVRHSAVLRVVLQTRRRGKIKVTNVT